MVLKLTKKAILDAISKKLDALDEREKLKTGKPYFPTKLYKSSHNPKKPRDHMLEMWFIFETADGVNFGVRMSKFQKIPEGQEHS